MRRPLFTECKTYGHAFFEATAILLRYPPGTYDTLHLLCDRCKAERHDFIDRFGDLISRRYVYPDGYRDAKDEKPSRAALRLMVLNKPLPRGVR